jgi:hypothetical protein
MKKNALPLSLILTATLVACSPAGDGAAYDRLDRLDFNRLAVRADLPLYWTSDANGNGAVDPDEVASLLFYPMRGTWVVDGEFSDYFSAAYEELDRIAEAEEPEDERLRLVHADLDHGIPTLVRNDLRDLPDAHRRFVKHMLNAAGLIDILYARKIGAEALEPELPDDSASRSLFRRNWGPRCVAPRTQDEPGCTAIPGAPAPVFDIYPETLQARDGFCERLASDLADPFTVVRESDGKLVAVPYTEAYEDEMTAVSEELRAAAAALVDPEEDALRAYLEAAAQSFLDNHWEPADEAWSRMNARNSRWYLRIAPDETYWEPCNLRAGFHLTLALINTDSLEWEDRILPVRQEMENALAELIGPPYRARRVGFHLPDFIDIVINAGDDRDPLGATIGQSLPNWGPVANEGRGRTVAMSNLYTDPDSVRIQREQVRSLFTESAMQHHSDDPMPGLLSTILHEASHNFGPAHEYRFQGKTDTEWFGGPLSTVMEELKAQTGALWFLDWLRQRGIIEESLARQTYLDSLRWAMDHISRGMYYPGGGYKSYSQLAAIQIGWLLDEGALEFDPDAPAANGEDHGAFTVHLDRLPAAMEKLMVRVGRIKASGDRSGAEELRAKYVDDPDALPFELIADCILRHPKANFVYSLEM